MAEYDFTVSGNGTLVLTTSGANAQAVMGDYAGHYVFVDEANQFQAAPVERTPTAHIAGWEGAGPQPADDSSKPYQLKTRAEIEKAFAACLRQVSRELAGEHATHAITALHGQRRANGRPVTFIPEID